MAKSARDSQSVIRDAFSPVIGVACSEDAAELCRKSCLSFAEMVQPFCRLSSEAHIRDSSGNACTLTDFRIIVRDATAPAPSPVVGARMLNNAVSQVTSETKDRIVSVGRNQVQYSGGTPWYEEYRECFLTIAQPSEHECLKHFCACVFVVSSAHDEPLECFQRLADGLLQQQQPPAAMPPPLAAARQQAKWLSPDLLRYFVLLHDVVSGDESRAEAVYQTVKARYGAQACHLLKINSVQPQINGGGGGPGTGEAAPVMAANPWSSCARRSYLISEESTSSIDYSDTEPEVPSPTLLADGHSVADYDPLSGSGSPPQVLSPLHPLAAFPAMVGSRSTHRPAIGCRLSLSDQDRLRIFVRELVVRALVPWAERTVRVLQDLCQSKKGLNRGLFKKWFNTKSSEKASDVVQYVPDSVEMCQRRLADLYFMFQMYDPAYQLYHSLKKDFEVDKAWMYCAGAQEMAALAVFMQGDRTQRQYPTHYMESAISSYATTCRSEYFAMRATMLNVEALKSKGMWMQASNALLRMCSDDASLRSALLLEQAAHCFLAGGISSSVAAGRTTAQPSARKFSWYLVLAGERYVRAGQKAHALRCLTTALQAHNGCGWTLAQDYINILCGRLRSSSADASDHDHAYTHFANTLRESYGQTATQQDVYLREFLGFCQLSSQQQEQAKSSSSAALLPLLPVPAVCHNDISVLTCRYEGDGILHPGTMDDRVYAASVTWQTLEDECIELCKARHATASISRPGIPCHTRITNNVANPSIPVGEVLSVRARLLNPLLVPLLLSDMRLLWQFHTDCDSGTVVHESHVLDEQAKTTIVEEFPISNITLDSGASNYVEFELRLLAQGTLVISGIQYKIGRVTFDKAALDDVFVRGRKELTVQGRRLQQTKADLLSRRCAVDKRLEIVSGPPAAKLKVLFCGFPAAMMCGELRRVQVRLENVGKVPLSYVSLACSDPVNVLVDAMAAAAAADVSGLEQLPPASAGMLSGSAVAGACCIPLPAGRLEPAHAVEVVLWLRGPGEDMTSATASRPVDFVFGYAGLDASTTAPTRLRFSRHSFAVTLEKSLDVRVATRSWGTTGAGDSLSKRLLLVELENRCQSSQERLTEFSIVQADSYSRQWSTSLAHACKETNLQVNHGEVAKLCLKANRSKGSTGGSAEGGGAGGHGTKKAAASAADGLLLLPSSSLQLPQLDSVDDALSNHSQLLPQHQEKAVVNGTATSIDRTTASSLMRQYAARRRAAAMPKPLCAAYSIVAAGAAAAASTTASAATISKDGFVDAVSVCTATDTSPDCCVLAIFWKACTILASGEMRDAFGIHVVPVIFDAATTYVPAAAMAALPPVSAGALRTTASTSDVASLSNARQGSIGSDMASLQQFDTALPAMSVGSSLPTTPECLVRFQYRHPTCLEADFGKQRLLSVPVALQLENLTLENVHVEVSKRSPPDGLPEGVHWTGKLQTRLQLQAREQVELTMLVTFAAEGTYSLNTLDVRAGTAAFGSGSAGVPLFSQKDVAPALIVVTDTDSAVS